MAKEITHCDHCGTPLHGDHDGIPWEAETRPDGGQAAHSRNRCRHVLRDKLAAARAAVVRFVVAWGPHLPDPWKDHFVKECGLVIDEGSPYQHPMMPKPGTTSVP